jgi:signal transduction histidine kinase
MNAGSNTIDPIGAPFAGEFVEERTSLLGSPPIRIWLTLLLVIFGIGGLGAFTQFAQAVATVERSSLLPLFMALAGATAMFAFTVGQAASAPLTRLAARTLHTGTPYGAAPPNGAADVADAGPSATESGSVESVAGGTGDDDLTEYFNITEAPTYDPLAEVAPASPGYIAGVRPAVNTLAATGTAPRPLAAAPGLSASGPRWLLAIDDFLTRPVSRRTIIATVTLSSVVCAVATWNWVGSIGETLTALIGVAVLSALFSRVTHMAARSRQVVDNLRTTNNHLVHEIVGRRGRDKSAAGEIDGEQRWASALEFDNAPLTDLEALRTKFLSEVSHELRGPITAINLAARIIMKHHIYDHEVVDRFGSTIVVEGDRLAHIVNDFLELAKIESCCIRWSDDRIEPKDIVATAIYAAEPAATEQMVKLVSDIDKDIKPMIADRDRIIQALTILVTTALRHTPENSTVTVHARRGAGETVFAVEDNGAGTRNDKPSSIFGGQREGSDERDGKENCGQGLGLCIASEIATHYGGEMWVEGRVGEGSAFVLSIPDESRDSVSTNSSGGSESDANDDHDCESTETEKQAFTEFEQSCPAPGDASQPVLTDIGAASAKPDVFGGEDNNEPVTTDSLGQTMPSPSDSDATAGADTTSDAGLTVDTQTTATDESQRDSAPVTNTVESEPNNEPEAATVVAAKMPPEPGSYDALLDSLATTEASGTTDSTDEAASPVVTYDPEHLPWDEEYEQPSASEQLSLRELDDMMYGRADVPTHDDSSSSSGNDSADSNDEQDIAPSSGAYTTDAPQESCDHAAVVASPQLTEVKRGFGFSLFRNEEGPHPTDDAAAEATAVSDDSNGQSEHDTDSLTEALTSLERTTDELTTEVATCEIQTADEQSNATAGASTDVRVASLDTTTALNAIAAGISSVDTEDQEFADSNAAAPVGPETVSMEEHTDSASEADSDDNVGDHPIRDLGRSEAGTIHASPRESKKEMRKPHGGWQLASRVGANFVRRTPHRR